MNDATGLRNSMDLRQMTDAERIWLWRRRQRNTTGRARGRGGLRMSFGEAAARLHLATSLYTAAENGTDRSAERMVIEAIDAVGETVRGRASPAEMCALARRRAAEPLEDLCRALGGVSKPTFFAREKEGSPELIDLWRARGYDF